MRRRLLVLAMLAIFSRPDMGSATSRVVNPVVPDATASIGDDGSLNPALDKAGSGTNGGGRGTKRDGSPGKNGGNLTIAKRPRTIAPRTPPRPCTTKQNSVTATGIAWACGPDGRLTKTYVCPIYTCTDPAPPTPGAATPPEPDIAWLVATGLGQIPLPDPMMTPPFERLPDAVGVVGIPVFFAIQPEQWRPHTATATDGPFHVTITATPTTITFTTGEAGTSVQCNGPGRRVTSTNQVPAAKRLNCFHTYNETPPANQNFDGSLTITWTTTVITDVTPAGRVTDLVPPRYTTTTPIDIPIIEIQPVLSG